MDITQILIEYKSVSAAILGSVATLIVTSLIKNQGKIHFSIDNWKIIFYSQDEIGAIVPIDNYKDALYCSFSFDLILYNNSEVPKSLKDVKIRFENQNSSIEIILSDSCNQKYSVSGIPLFNEIKVINVPPKQMYHIKSQGNLSESNFTKIKENTNNVFLLTTDYRNKIYKKLIDVVSLTN